MSCCPSTYALIILTAAGAVLLLSIVHSFSLSYDLDRKLPRFLHLTGSQLLEYDVRNNIPYMNNSYIETAQQTSKNHEQSYVISIFSTVINQFKWCHEQEFLIRCCPNKNIRKSNKPVVCKLCNDTFLTFLLMANNAKTHTVCIRDLEKLTWWFDFRLEPGHPKKLCSH